MNCSRLGGSVRSAHAWSRFRRLAAAQSSKPLSRATRRWRLPGREIRTKVHGVRVAKPLGDFLILRVMYESGGFGSAVSDEDVERTRLDVAEADGLMLSPEGAACVAAYGRRLRAGKWLSTRGLSSSTRPLVFARRCLPFNAEFDASKPIDYAAL